RHAQGVVQRLSFLVCHGKGLHEGVRSCTVRTTIEVMRLATFNILHGRSLVDDAVDLDRYARAVRALDADVLALQEVDRDQPRSHGADLTTIAAEAMGAVDHRFAATLAGLPTTWAAATGDPQPGTASTGVA